MIRIVWKHKVHILAAWAVLSAAVAVVVMLWPATYRAETLILVDSQKIPEKFVTATVNVDLQDRLATISQRILSSNRLEKIIERFNLYEKERKTHVQEEIIEMMRGEIKMTPEKGWTQNRPGAFRVSYEGRNPATVAEVTNQLGNLFIDENLRARETIAEGTSSFMKTQLEDAKKSLEQQEAKLTQFKQAYNGELPEQQASLAQELGRLQLQLQGNQDALNRASQNKLTLASSLSVSQSSEATLERLIRNAANPAKPAARADGQPAAAKKRSEKLEEDLAAMLTRYEPTHPDVRNLKATIEQVKAQEAKDEAAAEAAKRKREADAAKLNGETPAQAASEDPLTQNPEAVKALASERERVALLTAQIKAVDNEIKIRQAEQQKILARTEQVQGHLRDLPLREQEMVAITRDYELSKANYSSLKDKIFAADMAAEMEHDQKSERFTILDSARIPEKPISPNRPLFAGLGSAGALALSIAFWLFREIRKNKIIGEWELPEGAVVLGRVPRLSTAAPPAGKSALPRSAVAIATSLIALAAASTAVYLISSRL